MTNPYEPPSSYSREWTWWERLWNLVSRRPAAFRRGDAILWQGVAFYVDPKQPSALYAALPSSTVDDQRMSLLCDEVLRILPDFLRNHPDLHSLLCERALVVRMIDVYDKPDEDKRKPVVLSDAVAAALAQLAQVGDNTN